MCCLMIMQGFVEEVQSSPANAKSALTLLATLYGLTRVERRLAFYLAAGMLLPKADEIQNLKAYAQGILHPFPWAASHRCCHSPASLTNGCCRRHLIPGKQIAGMCWCADKVADYRSHGRGSCSGCARSSKRSVCSAVI